ncbi:NitT/TauT family transport system permease protein [Desulfitispora alkaliphila]|uniref:ABC transporter permease n=1 Tax=Desulfitispora alkaliphila TaxID=622674 RepID=UPI003D1BD4BB
MRVSTIKDRKKGLNKFLVFLFWIAVWQILYLIIQRDIYVPSPFDVFNRLNELIFMLSFWETVFSSIYRVIMGMLLSIVFGVVFGILASLNSYIFDLLNPLVSAIKSTPVISFIIIALIWFSSSNVPIFICFLMCFPIIWTNVVEGIRNVDKKLLEMADVYRVNRWLVLREIYLPSITPYFTAATITALGLGWKVSVAAEVLSHPRNGIGTHLYSAKVYLDSVDLFAWTLVVIILSILFENIFSRLLRSARKHRKELV